MNKVLNKIFYASALCLSITSCSDVLDKGPLGNYTEDVVWNDKNLAQEFIYQGYSSILKEYIYNPTETGNTYGCGNEDFSDNIVRMDMNSLAVNKNTLTPDLDCGWDRFALIRKANVIITKAAESKNIQNADKKDLIAQGKMLRAIVYYKLARSFGKCILIDKVLTTKDDLNIPRSATIKETYDFIIKDLQDAAADLVETAENGKFTKGAALALLSEVSLQAAAYAESGQAEYYEICKKACNDLFALNKYQLDPEYRKMFNDYDYAQTSKEIIFALWRSKDVTQFNKTPTIFLYPNGEISQIPADAFPKYPTDFLGWGSRFPSQDLVNEYEVVDKDGVAKKWNETSYYKNFKPGEDYVSNMMYAHRDSRFYASVVYDSTMLGKNLVLTRVKGSSNYYESNKSTNRRTPTGYWFRKAINDVDFVKATLYTNYHHVLFRLGRVYLNYAEALLRTGDVANAISYINKTRTVHGNLPALATTLSKDEAWKAYKSERRVDLFMEGDRYWSLLRWYKADGKTVIPELNHSFVYCEISQDGKSYTFKPLPSKAYEDNNTLVWDKRKFLLPVPKKYIELSDNVITQNDDWK